jgi:hypothetical protein
LTVVPALESVPFELLGSGKIAFEILKLRVFAGTISAILTLAIYASIVVIARQNHFAIVP